MLWIWKWVGWGGKENQRCDKYKVTLGEDMQTLVSLLSPHPQWYCSDGIPSHFHPPSDLWVYSEWKEHLLQLNLMHVKVRKGILCLNQIFNHTLPPLSSWKKSWICLFVTNFSFIHSSVEIENLRISISRLNPREK